MWVTNPNTLTPEWWLYLDDGVKSKLYVHMHTLLPSPQYFLTFGL